MNFLDDCYFCKGKLTEAYRGASTVMNCYNCKHNYRYTFYESGHMDDNSYDKTIWIDFDTENFTIIGSMRKEGCFINFSPKHLRTTVEENLVCDLSNTEFEKHYQKYVDMAMAGKLNNYLKKLLILQ